MTFDLEQDRYRASVEVPKHGWTAAEVHPPQTDEECR